MKEAVSGVGRDVRPAASFLGVGVLLFLVTSVPAVHRHVVVPFTELGAQVWAWSLGLAGEKVVRIGTLVVDPAAGFGLQILDGCNGLFASIILLAAMAAHRAPLAAKVVGFGAGLAVVFLANQVRLVALFWIGRSAPRYLEAAHVYAGPAGMVLLALGLWIAWAEALARPQPRRAGHGVG